MESPRFGLGTFQPDVFSFLVIVQCPPMLQTGRPMMLSRLLLLLLGLAAASGADDQRFYAHWADGRAEVSSYRVIQPRYGEERQGYAVLIFVTEDIHRETLIKAESPTPDAQRLYALKLNHVLKFDTGIYPYSVMTSVFSAVSGVRGDRPFELCKLTLSSQEWCGHVFDEIQVRGGELRGELNSYFEAEGRRTYELERTADFVSEDNLLILIRELRGPYMEEGERRQVELLPALWWNRLTHQAHALEPATVTKGAVVQLELQGETWQARRWHWQRGEYARAVWVEQAYPHRILRWENSAGMTGELMVTLREPYWQLNHNEDAVYRDKLRLPRQRSVE